MKSKLKNMLFGAMSLVLFASFLGCGRAVPPPEEEVVKQEIRENIDKKTADDGIKFELDEDTREELFKKGIKDSLAPEVYPKQATKRSKKYIALIEKREQELFKEEPASEISEPETYIPEEYEITPPSTEEKVPKDISGVPQDKEKEIAPSQTDNGIILTPPSDYEGSREIFLTKDMSKKPEGSRKLFLSVPKEEESTMTQGAPASGSDVSYANVEVDDDVLVSYLASRFQPDRQASSGGDPDEFDIVELNDEVGIALYSSLVAMAEGLDIADIVLGQLDGKEVKAGEIEAVVQDETPSVEIEEAIRDIPQAIRPAGPVVDFGPHGTVFNQPVIIKVPYDQESLRDAGVTDPSELKVYYYNEDEGEWTDKGVIIRKVDTVNKIIYAEVLHF